jgi:hypothetical protein
MSARGLLGSLPGAGLPPPEADVELPNFFVAQALSGNTLGLEEPLEALEIGI